MKKTIIFDGSNLLHRCFWVASARKNLSVEFLFLNSLRKCTQKFEADDILCVWDTRTVTDQKNFRQLSGDGQYKGNRDKERNKKVYSYIESVQSISTPLGISHLNPGVLEADDYIYWLCDYLDGEKVIVSSDGDLLQLVSDTCDVYNPIVNKVITMGTFEETVGLPTIDEYIAYKALIGDKSDNIPGLYKVGPKRAKALIAAGIENLTTEQATVFNNNIELIDLSCASKYHPEEAEIFKTNYEKASRDVKRDFSKFKSVCVENKLFSIVNKFPDWQRVFDKSLTIENIVAKLIRTNSA